MATIAVPNRVPLEDLTGQILVSGRITPSNRYQLMLTLLADRVSEEEHIMIDRLFYGVRKGLLRLD
ncbi:MAG: hypothetical protein ACAF41_12880 [Leptolyngbya sp. BL-A-14]